MATDWIDRIRLRSLKQLLSLAQTQNLSQSAALLNTTQPGLSKWLKDLETDIGLPLFERHARGLRPTPHGKALIAHARRIEAQLVRASTDMRALREGGSARVVIGASGAAASEVAPLAALSIVETVPQARIGMVEGTMDALLDYMAQGELDIVIGRTMANGFDGSQINSEILYVEPIVLIARPDHPLFEREEGVDWNELEKYRWLVWPTGTPIRKALEAALRAAQRPLPANFIESNSVIANITMLNNSDMIGTGSHRAALALANLNLLRMVPLNLEGFGSVSMYWSKNPLYPELLEQALSSIRRVALTV